MPPTVQVAALAGSGANRRPCFASSAFSAAHVTPGSTVIASAVTARMRLKLHAQVEDDGRPETLAGQPGAGPAGNDGEVVLEAVPHEHGDVVGVFRDGDCQRRDLERAGVGRVQPAREGVEVNDPAELPAKVVGDLLFVEHGLQSRVRDSSTGYRADRVLGRMDRS